MILCLSQVFGSDKVINLKRVSQPPRVDALFDDECWGEVEWIDDFVQSEPIRKAPPSERTEFKVVQYKNDLYFAVKCYDRRPSEITALQKKEDGGMGSDDWFEIMIDTYLDRRNFYSFCFNPMGTKRDEKWGNLEWDGDWEVVAKVTDEGWVAELRISLIPLAFPRRGEGYFGINFKRNIRRLREENIWSFTMDVPNRVDDFGLIGPIDFSSIPFNSRLETLLYGVGGFGVDTSWHMGLDATKFLTPDFKCALTLFPDYSDIEAVYESIDITYTERWLPEKRPFFTEGSEFFGTFYSRRIDKFDLGFKAFGKQGKNQIGFLNCARFSPFRNDTILNISHNPTHQSSIIMTIQSRLEEDHKNIVLAGGGGGGTSEYSFGAFYGVSLTEPGENGFITHIDCWKRLGERSGLFVGYSAMSPNFTADIQYLPEKGVKGMNGGFYHFNISPRGLRWWEAYGVNVEYSKLDFWTGGLKAENKSVNFYLGLRGDWFFSLGRSISFYSPFPSFPTPFRDHFTSFSLGAGSPEKRYGWGFSYGKGVRMNQSYKFASGSIGRQLMNDKLNISLNFEKRWVGLGNGWQTAQQWWGSIAYDIGREFWFVIRIYGLKDDESHHNISAVVRRRGGEKRDFYLVIGDPLGTEFKERIAIKYIFPL
ncbi:carbohydrate binding family 9 domain-containing protein [bacterium]|nr:carbohydrate binding family 9 domain-containing protein [bacterium]